MSLSVGETSNVVKNFEQAVMFGYSIWIAPVFLGVGHVSSLGPLLPQGIIGYVSSSLKVSCH